MPEPEQMQTSGVSDPQEWLIDSFGGGDSWSGVKVNSHSVLSSGPVYQAITLISDTLASLPIEVYRQGSTTNDRTHPISKIFNEIGNDHMLPFHVRQTLMAHTLLYGNGIGVIEWTAGKPTGIYPMPYGTIWGQLVPYTPQMEEVGLAGSIVYHYAAPNGATGTLFPDEVFHLKMYGSGLWGYSPLSLFGNMFGNGLAAEQFQGYNFRNAARPSGVLKKEYGDKIPAKIPPEAQENMRRMWNDFQSGLDNTGKIAVLSHGLTWVPMSVNAKDAAMIESLSFYREQVAAVYKIPPHKLGALQNSAVRANIEEQNRSFVQDCLRPHATVWEQESAWKLTSYREKQRKSIEVRLNFQELLRADLATRYNSYATGRQWGWLSVNDIRGLEHLDEVQGGDEYLRPLNMVSVEHAQEMEEIEAEKANEPEPAPEPIGSEDEGEEQEPTEGQAEPLMVYARKALQNNLRTEILNLQRMMNSRKPFERLAAEYYEKLPTQMLEPLEPLTQVSGFIGPQELDGLVTHYVDESFGLVRDCKTTKQLLDAVVQFPPRVDAFLEKMRADP